MDSMNERSAADELAAAEAELKAAQERLDAARLRMASEQPQPYAQPADAPVDSQGAQSQPQPYTQAQQVPYVAQPAQPASFGSQSQPAADSTDCCLAARCATGAGPAGPALRAATRRPAAGPAVRRAAARVAVRAASAASAGDPAAVWGAAGLRVRAAAELVRSAAQYGYQQPYVAPAVGEKDHVAAGLLALFLGWLGVHKFYLGYNTSGFIMLGTSILGGILTLSVASWAIWVIAIVEGIFYLSKSQTEFEQMYVINKREWF